MKQFSCLIIILLLTISVEASLANPRFSLIYVVQEGDTLGEIAQDYGVSVRELLEKNDLPFNTIIRVGQELLIPNQLPTNDELEWNQAIFAEKREDFSDLSFAVGQIYSIRVNPQKILPEVNIPSDQIIKYHIGVGDTLYDLAKDFNTSMGVIMALNKMENSVIRTGRTIYLPINNLTSRQVLAKTVSEKEINLLARAIFGEARGEPFIGQVAVGAVIINRVIDRQFPNNIRDVIYQPRQISAVADGQFYLTPNSTAYKAAKEALAGKDPTMGSLYYYNPRTAAHLNWFSRLRTMVTIGQHVFAK